MPLLPSNIDVRKYLNRTTLTIVGVALLGVSILIGWNLNTKLSIAKAELASKNIMYSLVAKEKQRLDSLIGYYAYSIQKRDTIIALKDKEISNRVSRIVQLENKIKTIQSDVDKVSVDSSYAYINNVVPPKGEQKFGFDSIQVKTIHRTFLERDELRNINLEYSFTTGTMLASLMLKSDQIVELKSLVKAHEDREAILKKEDEAKNAEIKGLEKTSKQFKRQRNLSIVGAAAIIIIQSIAK